MIIKTLIDTARTRTFLSEHGPFRPPSVLHIPRAGNGASTGLRNVLQSDVNIVRWCLQAKNKVWFECGNTTGDTTTHQGNSQGIYEHQHQHQHPKSGSDITTSTLARMGLPSSCEFEALNGYPLPSPVLQVGTDFYLGTTAILSAIEKRLGYISLFPHPQMGQDPSAKYPRYREAESRALRMWIDSSLKSVLAFTTDDENVSAHYLRYCLRIINNLLVDNNPAGPSVLDIMAGTATPEREMVWNGLYGPASSVHLGDIYSAGILLSLYQDPRYKRPISEFPLIINWLEKFKEFFEDDKIFNFPIKKESDMNSILATRYMRNEYGTPSADMFRAWIQEGPNVRVTLSTGIQFTGNFVAETEWDYTISRKLLPEVEGSTGSGVLTGKTDGETIRDSTSDRKVGDAAHINPAGVDYELDQLASFGTITVSKNLVDSLDKSREVSQKLTSIDI